MNSKITLRAFTLWELLIAMLITSLIVALSYGIYWKFMNMIYQEEKQEEKMLDIRMLERELFRLAQSCESIVREGDRLDFIFSKSQVCSVEFTDSLMSISIKDYFDLDNRDEPVRDFSIEGWSVQYLNEQTDLISSFQINCRANQQVYTLLFKKNYSSLILYRLSES